jgi:hypothetical protein
VDLLLSAGYPVGMRWRYYNPNPTLAKVGDCTVRAISKLTRQDWEHTYVDLCIQGFLLCDLPSSNTVWGAYLRGKGFKRNLIPDGYPDYYTVSDFARDHPSGEYLLATNGHVVAVVDGQYCDSWDSGAEIPIYYWRKET